MTAFIDLHIHTTASDGTLSPSAVVALSESIGLAAIAITDHDTVAGFAEGYAAAQGIEVISGVELSVKIQHGSAHIVGLWLDHTNPVLSLRLTELIQSRVTRNTQIAARLTELGMPVSIEEVAAVAGGDVIGRPHFAEVLLKRGYVSSTEQAFQPTGRPCFRR